MKNIMKEAHNLTKKIIKTGDNYRATFRLCLIFVHSQIKKVVVKMVELKGTEKQVKWANEIKENATNIYNTTFAKAKEITANAPSNANKDKFEAILNKMELGYNAIMNIEESSTVITNFKNIKVTDFLFATDFNYLQGGENNQIEEDFKFFSLVASKMNLI